MSERTITFGAAWDKRDPNPSKNYGVHGVDLRFVLKGAKGAVQFVLYTGWMLPHVTKEFEAKGLKMTNPLPADLGYHSHVPMYEGQSVIEDHCSYIGGPCYYDGSGLNAEPVFDTLLSEGSDGVWRKLEEYYVETFGEPA